MNRGLRLIVDTDTGTDDAVALALALRLPGVQVERITTVAGNTTLENATRNARYVAELCGSGVGIHPGAARPLLREPPPPRFVHGRDGLGDIGFPPPRGTPSSTPASQAIMRAAAIASGALTLVALGPLTNVALALRERPELAQQLRRCVVMGGTLAADAPPDFNLRADPEAARLVLRSGMRVTVVPLDLSRGAARIAPSAYEGWLRSADPVSRFAGLMCRFLGARGRAEHGWDGEAAVPDALAMAVALEPDLAEDSLAGLVDVELADGAGRLRIEPAAATSRVHVVRRLNTSAFHGLLGRAFGRQPEHSRR